MSTVMNEVKRLADVKAPRGFAERVLAQAGVADSYAVFETVLGPVYVAWNPRGVSAAMRSKSAVEFEEWFARDVRRRLVRVDPLRGRQEHEDLLLPDVLPRPARARRELRVLPRRGRGARVRLPTVQGLPSGGRLGRQGADACRERRGPTVVGARQPAVVV